MPRCGAEMIWDLVGTAFLQGNILFNSAESYTIFMSVVFCKARIKITLVQLDHTRRLAKPAFEGAVLAVVVFKQADVINIHGCHSPARAACASQQ